MKRDYQTIAAVLDRAADLYETGRVEWCQGLFSGDGQACVLGACHLAWGLVYGSELPPMEARWRKEEPAENFDVDLVEILGFADGGAPEPPDWNDALGRTKEDVVARLRERATFYRERAS